MPRSRRGLVMTPFSTKSGNFFWIRDVDGRDKPPPGYGHGPPQPEPGPKREEVIRKRQLADCAGTPGWSSSMSRRKREATGLVVLVALAAFMVALTNG